MGSGSNQSVVVPGQPGHSAGLADEPERQRCAGRHAVIDGFALRAEAVIPKPGGDAHGLALEICPFSIICQAATGSYPGRYRVVGSVAWDRATPEAVRLVEIW